MYSSRAKICRVVDDRDKIAPAVLSPNSFPSVHLLSLSLYLSRSPPSRTYDKQYDSYGSFRGAVQHSCDNKKSGGRMT